MIIGGADWQDVARIIEDELCANDVPVFIYDYEADDVEDSSEED